MDNIKEIVEQVLHTNIVKLLEMEGWEENKRSSHIKKIIETINNLSTAEVLNSLPKNDLDQYKILLDENNDKAETFLLEKVPDVKEIVAAKAFEVQLELMKDLEMYKKVLAEKNLGTKDNSLFASKSIIEQSFVDILNMNDWTEQDKDDYLDKITAIIEQRTLGHVLDELNDEDKIEFSELIDTNQEKAWDWLTKKIPDMNDVALFEIAKLKFEMAK